MVQYQTTSGEVHVYVPSPLDRSRLVGGTERNVEVGVSTPRGLEGMRPAKGVVVGRHRFGSGLGGSHAGRCGTGGCRVIVEAKIDGTPNLLGDGHNRV